MTDASPGKAEGAIRILVTGGTFDKEYDEIHGRLFFKDSHVREMLELGRCKLDLTIRTLMMIDSLDMTAADRDLIVHACRDCEEQRVVITHGTDTMTDTARVLAQNGIDKTIVLTAPWCRTSSVAPTGFSISGVRWPSLRLCRRECTS